MKIMNIISNYVFWGCGLFRYVLKIHVFVADYLVAINKPNQLPIHGEYVWVGII